MKTLKKNQIIIFVIALMLVTAGYLNYTANNDMNLIQTSTQVNSIDYGGIGDAKLVSANAIDEENVIENESDIKEENNEEEIKTTNAKEVNEYFTSSKLTRDAMYSQMIETYEKILQNESIPSDQKTIAQTEIKNINDNKNKIMICENLIKTKGIEDSVIFINDQSISIVIRADKLEQEQIAQIQNIISREMEVDISNIHISNK